MYGKWRMYVGNCLYIWETAKICVKWLRSVENGSNIWEMALAFDKRLKYVGIDLEILGNGENIWKMA